MTLPSLETKDYHVRAIERSTKIVAFKKPKVVLQAPRGNLESIFPRLPVLYVIHEFLSKKNFLGAFLECRKNKINTNVLYDLNPGDFIGNIKLFIEQLNNV